MVKIKILSREDVKKVLKLNDVIESVITVYRKKSEKQAESWPTVFYDFGQGKADMDIKSGYIKDIEIFGHKTTSWFGENEGKGLPSLNNLIIVFNGKTGIPAGIVEGTYIKCMETGAAGAVGAKLLSRPESENLMILGAGEQAFFQVGAALTMLPRIRNVRVVDVFYPDNAKKFVNGISGRLFEEFGIDVSYVKFEAFNDLKEAVSLSDVIITVTPSRKPLILKEWVKPGTHFSCIGADMEGKEEIDAEIFYGARVFNDDIKQCVRAGETEIPIKTKVILESDITGEIGDILTGKVPGRTDDNQITIFDAAGMAILDLAVARLALDSAVQNDLGINATL